MLIEVWNPASPLPDTGYLYFRPEDEIVVKEAIAAIAAKDKTFPIPLTVLVKPNGEKQLGLIHAHIIGSSRNDTSWIEKAEFGAHEYPTRRILELGAEIVSGLRDHSSERVGVAALALEYLISKIPGSLRTSTHDALLAAAGYLAELAFQCLAVLEHGSPFAHTVPTENNRSWWLQTPALISNLRSKKNDIPLKFGLTTTKALDAVDTWLTKMLVRLARLSQSTKIKRNDALLEASAYCAALAERYLLRGNAALAILLLYRSADLCLLYVCSQHNGIVDWTHHGGKFDQRVVSGKDTRIALRNSIDVVESMKLLPPDPKRAATFILLNEWRNQLLHTHYLSDVDDSAARDVFRKVRPYLELIGDADWKLARDFYLRGVLFSVSDFLNIDGSLTETFEVVQLV